MSNVFRLLHIEAEVHDVAVLDYIVFAFNAEFTGFAACRFRTESVEVFVFNHFGAYEAAFKVGVDNSGALWCFHAVNECPSADFVATGCEEGAQAQEMVG